MSRYRWMRAMMPGALVRARAVWKASRASAVRAAAALVMVLDALIGVGDGDVQNTGGRGGCAVADVEDAVEEGETGLCGWVEVVAGGLDGAAGAS